MSQIKTIDPKTLKSWLEKSDCTLIDVREPFEYKEAHIEQATNIPLSLILTKIQEIQGLENKKIVLQCAAGVRSMNGCLALEKDGFKYPLWNLEGGITSWIASGLSVVKKK